MRQETTKFEFNVDGFIKRAFGSFIYSCVTVRIEWAKFPNSAYDKRMNLEEILNEFEYLQENNYVCKTIIYGNTKAHFMLVFTNKNDEEDVRFYEFCFYIPKIWFIRKEN